MCNLRLKGTSFRFYKWSNSDLFVSSSNYSNEFKSLYRSIRLKL